MSFYIYLISNATAVACNLKHSSMNTCSFFCPTNIYIHVCDIVVCCCIMFLSFSLTLAAIGTIRTMNKYISIIEDVVVSILGFSPAHWRPAYQIEWHNTHFYYIPYVSLLLLLILLLLRFFCVFIHNKYVVIFPLAHTLSLSLTFTVSSYLYLDNV